MNIYNKSLEELENTSYGDIKKAPTGLVKNCIRISKIPLKQYSIADIRVMVAQKFGLKYLVPMALERLTEDILIDADLYNGDLLESVLKIKDDYWKDNPSHKEQFLNLLKTNQKKLIDEGFIIEQLL